MAGDLHQIVSELMRCPLGEFAAARNARVSVLRTEGDADLAGRVAALRKPSVVLWALNRSGDVAGGDLGALRSAGDRLRHAQERVLEGDRAAAEQMSAAGQEQRRAIDAVTLRLTTVLTEAGHAASEDALRRIRDALRNASVADDETWDALQAGHLLSAPEPASFPELDASAMQRVADDHVDREAEARRKRIAAAEADVQRAADLERTAVEQEEAARLRRAEATSALHAARDALSRLQRERG